MVRLDLQGRSEEEVERDDDGSLGSRSTQSSCGCSEPVARFLIVRGDEDRGPVRLSKKQATPHQHHVPEY